MNEFNNNDLVTDWDLTAFTSSQQVYHARPSLFTGDKEDVHALNGMDIFNTPPHLGEQDEKFCTRNNVDSRLRFLNQEFMALGFQTLFPKGVIAGRETDARFDLSRLINVAYDLLKAQKQQMKARDDLEAKHVRSEVDNDALLQSQSRLKEELEAAKREICVSQMREKRLTEQFKLLQQERKLEREEMKKMRSDMQHKHKQFIHESKRREKEMHKLKERLHQLLTDKTLEKRMGMEVLNSIQRADGKRKLWKTGGKDEEKMYQRIISNYEEKHQELTLEITLLREYLADIQKELSSLVAQKTVDCKNGNEEYTDEKPLLDDGHFQMPFHVVGEDVKSHFRVAWQQLKEKLEQNSSKGSSPIDNDSQVESEASSQQIASMKEQIDDYRSIISKQEQLLKSLQDDTMMERIETYLRGDDTIKEREQKLRKEREKLLNERKVATELALNLAQDREGFEKEKMEFYKHCISTPVIRNEARDTKKGIQQSQNRTKFQSADPVFSPSPKFTSIKSKSADQQKTPSTAELYRYMSLAIYEDVNGDHDGSYLEEESEKAPVVRTESNASNTGKSSGNRSGIRKERVAEHAENVRRVLEKMPRRSFEEVTAVY
ncbi:afadin- and alpha-actinin-binding protein B-like [Rhopilema esculentum]|uniref:afadin- and alpha-actinin-binding protein B-like n=1 Tax=Rhopilema esculentum TaxID=499914 RepID=UPI0031DC364F